MLHMADMLRLGIVVVAAGALTSQAPPTSTPPVGRAVESADRADEPVRQWRVTLDRPHGELVVAVGPEGRHVLLNGQPLTDDRLIWRRDHLLLLVDEDRGGHVEIGLAPEGRTRFVRRGVLPVYPGPMNGIGISINPVGEALAAQLGLDPPRALLVTRVFEGLPAARSGMKKYDVIVAVDDQPVVDEQLLSRVIRSRQPGETVTLRLIRRAAPLELSVPVETFEQPLFRDWRDEHGNPLPAHSGDLADLGFFGSTPAADDEWDFGLMLPQSSRQIIEFFPEGEKRRGVVRAPSARSSATVVGADDASVESSGNQIPVTAQVGDDSLPLSQRLRVLEQRLERIEALLERLVNE